MPRRDVRWILIVSGVALTILGVLLLVVGAIVSSAVAAGSRGCSGPACTNVDPGVWLEWTGAPFLALGLGLLLLGVWWAIR